MSYLKSLKSTVLSLHLEYQVHLLAFGVLLLSIVLAWNSPSSYAVQQPLMLISSLGFAAGFSVWCWPTAKKVWAHPIGKAAIATFHVSVLFLSTAFARFVVASSLGLPPQDFDMTVAAISLASYIPAWSLAISIVLGVVAVALEIAGFCAMLAKHSFGTVAKLFARMFGAIAICAVSGDICGFAMKNETLLHPAAKWIAYFCDFQPAVIYPGIAEGERIRLHENGVISVAKIHVGEISIQVRKYEQ